MKVTIIGKRSLDERRQKGIIENKNGERHRGGRRAYWIFFSDGDERDGILYL